MGKGGSKNKNDEMPAFYQVELIRERYASNLVRRLRVLLPMHMLLLWVDKNGWIEPIFCTYHRIQQLQ